MQTIDEMSAVDVEPIKYGKWVKIREENVHDGAGNPLFHIECSECSFYWREAGHAKFFKRCPECDAKMNEEKCK